MFKTIEFLYIQLHLLKIQNIKKHFLKYEKPFFKVVQMPFFNVVFSPAAPDPKMEQKMVPQTLRSTDPFFAPLIIKAFKRVL